MAITGYFIDIDWKLNEILFKFEYMKEDYFDKIFSGVLISMLDNFSIRDRILAVTTDNASNNNMFMGILNKEFRKSVTEIFGIDSIFYILCLVYVIQLTVKVMMGWFKIESKNDLMEVNWEGDKVAEEIKKAIRIVRILAKIYHDQCNDLIMLIKISY
jgi:hypothetical protein